MFFGMGWQELLIIAAVALIVVGPQDLPKMLRQMGGWLGQLQRIGKDVRNSVDDALREADLKDAVDTVKSVRNFTPAGAATSFINKELASADKANSAGDGSSDAASASSQGGDASAADSASQAPIDDGNSIFDSAAKTDPAPPSSTVSGAANSSDGDKS